MKTRKVTRNISIQKQYKEFLRQSPTILTNHKKKIQVMPEYMGDKKFVQTRNTRVNYVTVDVKEGFNDAFRDTRNVFGSGKRKSR